VEPKKVGRALGIGVRVASKMVRERVAAAAAAPAAATVPAHPAASVRPATPPSDRAAAAKRGFKALGQALLGPFTHAGGVLWLEITGLFFAFFALFFVQSIYRVHTAWRQGPEHAHLLLYTLLAAGFGWFSFSSFARAYRKSKRGPHARP
jgi:Na+/H+-translocating membrane pyrophosphatase